MLLKRKNEAVYSALNLRMLVTRWQHYTFCVIFLSNLLASKPFFDLCRPNNIFACRLCSVLSFAAIISSVPSSPTTLQYANASNNSGQLLLLIVDLINGSIPNSFLGIQTQLKK